MSRRKSSRPAKKATLNGWILPAILMVLFTTLAYGAGAQAESRDAFCAACHTQNETVYVARAQEPAVDLASKHARENVGCIDCHSGKGVPGRISAEVLGARDALVFVSGKDVQPHTMTRAIADENCLKCHTKITEKSSFDNHYHLLLPRWQQASSAAAACVDCHQGHPSNGNPKITFLNEQATRLVCQSCHSFAGEG